MKNKILSVICAVLIGFSMNTSVLSVCAEELGELESESKETLLYETDVITQNDYETGFQDYACPEATADFSPSMYAASGNNLANVVGVVKDYNTEALVSGATISVNGESIVVTGEDGRFQIKNIPSGVYNWSISAAGYCAADYYNYKVDSMDGTTIFTFYVNNDFAVYKDREIIVNDGVQTVPPESDIESYADSNMARSLKSIPNVSTNVKVFYNKKTQSVNRQTYIYTVLSSELYETSYYTNKNMTSAQINELYHAQAVAANTFLEYSLSVYSNHSSKDYKVCATACCQVYDPTKVTEAAIDATATIFYTSGGKSKTDIVMYRPTSSTYDYIWGAFFSSCGGKGTIEHKTQPALKAVSCTDIASGAGGHRYGLCQMGAAQRAKNGKSASDILLYYYSGCNIVSCTLN